ncbi:hypothetical protein [Streptomyces anulatus]|uniref:hypothetical protein n=1 Tax=Streptomyces anulatus TaxID=1892 RepID=UPI0038703564|nr:hypothetical protein OG536_38630 [Streptomyces anulatus]
MPSSASPTGPGCRSCGPATLRIGLASVGRAKGKDAIAIADQGGWARHSRSMLIYMQRNDGWDDNASAGLA